LLEAQRHHWEHEYETPQRFGVAPSHAAVRAAGVFARAGAHRVLELGCGHGRDALFFASRTFEVEALDYASPAIDELRSSASEAGLSKRIAARTHDLREALPFAGDTFDAIFAHMVHNMAFSDDELVAIFAESRRVLRDGGTIVFSVRTTGDPDASAGRGLAGFLRDVDGDVIRFFSDACLTRFCAPFERIATETFEEGSLPKRLALVTLRKRSPVMASRRDADA